MTHLLLAAAFVAVGVTGVAIGWFFRAQDCAARHGRRFAPGGFVTPPSAAWDWPKLPPPPAPVQLPPSRRA